MSIKKPQNGKSATQSYTHLGELGSKNSQLSVAITADGRVGSLNDKSVLEGDINAPYSGNPARMVPTNRRAVKRSSVMKRKSSMYLSRRYSFQSRIQEGMWSDQWRKGHSLIRADGRMGDIELLAMRRRSSRGVKIS
jgi:hypothetical protein